MSHSTARPRTTTGLASFAIDLGHPRDVGEILGGAFKLYRRRIWLFATIAFSVVVPIDVAV